ncbi:MAG: 4-hydroxy-tetrahydrodipicolinate reductase, partial [Mesorhizobium sp.]
MPQQPLKIAIAGALGRMGREMTEAVQVDGSGRQAPAADRPAPPPS